jgi:hypothetical protein
VFAAEGLSMENDAQRHASCNPGGQPAELRPMTILEFLLLLLIAGRRPRD